MELPTVNLVEVEELIKFLWLLNDNPEETLRSVLICPMYYNNLDKDKEIFLRKFNENKTSKYELQKFLYTKHHKVKPINDEFINFNKTRKSYDETVDVYQTKN